MKMKALAAGLALGLALSACKQQPVEGTAPGAPAEAAAPATGSISDGQRAVDTIQIQNLMSRHEYMHAAGRNLEELDSYWVSRNGKFAATATFGSPAWVMYGVETIRKAYGEKSHADAEAARKQLSGIDPSVKDTDAFFGAGAEWVMHNSTTPIIEIADDGKTAQGAWYSPGIGVMPQYQDGKIHLQSMLFNEKYGGDFIKEDGKWRIWHLQMAYDFVPGLPEDMLKQLNEQLGALALGHPLKQTGGEAGERMGGELPEGFRKPLYSYPAYSPQRASVIWPKLPEPYATFSKSKYTNCNCEQDVPAEASSP
ncbi:nuclear transport factor 2 family protein [Pseudoxanthomonas sp.]|uniref:nuclear transport factor 2 family protein n=1 Tax=Pseudoxanthomonas sp. TaxID=1871049 RepID=UPI00260BCE2F|nr:nuclear transport factor 2 family protein [Pseudoxanthomonas sp.]WDS35033.1 MAG: nuclear transport factor 2 family protein [Pseudoxanthomonas sp.]